jgi:hypothetical protein
MRFCRSPLRAVFYVIFPLQSHELRPGHGVAFLEPFVTDQLPLCNGEPRLREQPHPKHRDGGKVSAELAHKAAELNLLFVVRLVRSARERDHAVDERLRQTLGAVQVDIDSMGCARGCEQKLIGSSYCFYFLGISHLQIQQLRRAPHERTL